MPNKDAVARLEFPGGTSSFVDLALFVDAKWGREEMEFGSQAWSLSFLFGTRISLLQLGFFFAPK